jgi:hypothetical protein
MNKLSKNITKIFGKMNNFANTQSPLIFPPALLLKSAKVKLFYNM